MLTLKRKQGEAIVCHDEGDVILELRASLNLYKNVSIEYTTRQKRRSLDVANRLWMEEGDTVRLPGDIIVHAVTCGRTACTLSFDSPENITVDRSEVYIRRLGG